MIRRTEVPGSDYRFQHPVPYTKQANEHVMFTFRRLCLKLTGVTNLTEGFHCFPIPLDKCQTDNVSHDDKLLHPFRCNSDLTMWRYSLHNRTDSMAFCRQVKYTDQYGLHIKGIKNVSELFIFIYLGLLHLAMAFSSLKLPATIYVCSYLTHAISNIYRLVINVAPRNRRPGQRSI
jgi:hypothetical protein